MAIFKKVLIASRIVVNLLDKHLIAKNIGRIARPFLVVFYSPLLQRTIAYSIFAQV